MNKNQALSLVAVNAIAFLFLAGFFMIRQFEIKAFGSTSMSFVYLAPVLLCWIWMNYYILAKKS